MTESHKFECFPLLLSMDSHSGHRLHDGTVDCAPSPHRKKVLVFLRGIGMFHFIWKWKWPNLVGLF